MTGPSTSSSEAIRPTTGHLVYARLTLAADRLDDAEANRKASTERLRSLMTKVGESPPEGIGARSLAELVTSNGAIPEAKSLAQELALTLEIERIATLELRHAMRTHPLSPWVALIMGIGEKGVGRLLGAVGDPGSKVDSETGEVTPRSLSQLRSFCGYGDARAQRRKKGQKVNWNPRARTAVWNIAEAAFRQGEYRRVYVTTREKYEDATHDEKCPQCKSEAGTPLRDGHKHARAHRAVAKAFLSDLWREAHLVTDLQAMNGRASKVSA